MTEEPLATALEAERDALQAFLRLLRDEQQALVQFDTEAVAALGPNKAGLIEKLAAFDHKRQGELVAHELDTGPSGIEAWLRGEASSPSALEQLQQLWKELIAAARAARSLVDQNQMLIADRLTRSRRALAALRAAASVDQVYVADGNLQQVLPRGYFPFA